jgi:hypothetical protein
MAGCPVYSDNSGTYRSCDGQTCWSCPTQNGPNGYGGYEQSQCTPWNCNSDLDCPGGYYCGANATCLSIDDDAGVPAATVDASTPLSSGCGKPSDCQSGYTCGAGGACELGDCSVTGCVSGYVCELENATLQCVSEAPAPTPVFDAGTFDSGTVACQSSSDCSTTGALCLDGQCVAPADQCFDETQCSSGDRCVAGACTPTCAGGSSCPTGYSCTNLDAGPAVCSGNPAPCEANPSICGVGAVCSQNHCVAPCGTGGSCASGSECIQGGCVPNQLATFTCENDGVQDACASGSICLHHLCYIACNPDAGAGDASADGEASTGCPSENDLNECKLVSESGTGYYVCGSSTNLGDQCNPTTGLACANPSSVCIDGFCY